MKLGNNLGAARKGVGARTLLTAGVAAAVLAVAGCSGSSGGGSGSNGSGGSKSDYVIGMTEDLSGPVSAYGQNVRKVWTAYTDNVNASGGVNGHKIVLKVLDDKSDPTTASANARQLIADGAILITGSTLSNICAVVAPLAIQSKVPVSCWVGNPSQMVPVNQYVFERFLTEAVMAKPMLTFATSLNNGKAGKLAIVATTAGGAQAWAKAEAKLAGDAGWTVVKNVTVDASQGADVNAAAANVAASKPDVVMFEIAQPADVQFMRQLRTLGLQAPAIQNFEDYAALSTLAESNFYQVWQSQYVPTSPTTADTKQYVSLLGKQGLTSAGDLNLITSGANYSAISEIVAAMKSCGNCTRASLTDAMNKTTVSVDGLTIGDGFGFTSADHVPVKQVDIYQWDASSGSPKQVQQGVAVGSPTDGS